MGALGHGCRESENAQPTLAMQTFERRVAPNFGLNAATETTLQRELPVLNVLLNQGSVTEMKSTRMSSQELKILHDVAARIPC